MKGILFTTILLTAQVLASQSAADWPAACRVVEIPSTADGSQQPAYFYPAEGSEARPLIISLHTWSNGYDQRDTLAWIAVERNFNYIHPDFRGPNNRPEACGSDLAIQDIEDAIAYALEHGPVDRSQIHVVGVSGGGYATLLTYMNSTHPVRTFSAWVPISNLIDWYYESVGRQQRYAQDIAQVTNPKRAAADDYAIGTIEAYRRSPIFMSTPTDLRNNSTLYLFAGIHDGYEGSVPITHSLKFYNKVVGDFDPEATDAMVSTEQMLSLLERRNSNISHPKDLERGMVHFQQAYQDKVQVVIFEGGHELLPGVALQMVKEE